MSTPMLKQYYKIKKNLQDTILLFRLGDFYEGFEEDAKKLSKTLGITLTGRGKGKKRIPMAGIPHHALKQYLPKLVKAGHKVAIAEQMEEATPGQLVERDVVKVVTAGTIVEESMLDESDNNYLVSIFRKTDKRQILWGLSYADISTGEFRLAEYMQSSSQLNSIPKELVTELFRIRPAEILVPRGLSEVVQDSFVQAKLHIIEDREIDYQESKRILIENLNVSSLKGFGIEDLKAGITAAGALFEYLLDTQKNNVNHITRISLLNNQDYMLLDQATIRNLELLFPIQSDKNTSTLYSILNKCATPMGQRKLRQWILRPLIKLQKITNRLDTVDELYKDDELLRNLNTNFNGIMDLERVLARIGTKSANARDMVFLADGLKRSLAILAQIKESDSKVLQKLMLDIDLLKQIKTDVIALIQSSIKPDPAITITEGNIIKTSYNSDLKTIKDMEIQGKEYIASLQRREIKRTGIPSLKVKFNKVFGYHIEITKSNLDKVPDNYVRKQTLVNAERYITEELKKWEEKILGAEDKAAQLEYEIFEDIRTRILENISVIQKLVSQISTIDVLVNFANISKQYEYIRPEVLENCDESTEIIDGRHPVVEEFVEGQFIPNDLFFQTEDNQLIILTGPNMSGKSTYIRQCALLFIIAQIGCFVPAKRAKIVIADRIFTRVGASDNLAGGESTFMVEMNETANILNNATSQSILILDEVGRGTSTYDGVAIAWAIVEYLASKVKARTLFATHYHELMQLESKYNSIKNFNVQVKESGGKILFMRKIIKGGTDRSYGIHVAELAGVPKEVINKANRILENLEDEHLELLQSNKINAEQLFFERIKEESVVERELIDLDTNMITPLDALLKLKELKERIGDGNNDS